MRAVLIWISMALFLTPVSSVLALENYEPAFTEIGNQSSPIASLSDYGDVPLPDYDLHAFTPDGRHVGMNYTTGIYENQIEGATASGDMPMGVEWIFIPEYEKVIFKVSNRNTMEFLKKHPEAANAVSSMKYNITFYHEDSNSTRSYSSIEGQQIESGEERDYYFDAVENPDGTFKVVLNREPPVIRLYPVNGTEFYSNQYLTINYSVTAARGVSSESVTLDGRAVAKGDVIALSNLSAGSHVIRVDASDTAGNSSEASTTFIVRPAQAPERALSSSNNLSIPSTFDFFTQVYGLTPSSDHTTGKIPKAAQGFSFLAGFASLVAVVFVKRINSGRHNTSNRKYNYSN